MVMNQGFVELDLFGTAIYNEDWDTPRHQDVVFGQAVINPHTKLEDIVMVSEVLPKTNNDGEVVKLGCFHKGGGGQGMVYLVWVLLERLSNNVDRDVHLRKPVCAHVCVVEVLIIVVGRK